MPDIGEIMETTNDNIATSDGQIPITTQATTETATTTAQYLILPNLDDTMELQQANNTQNDAGSTVTASYSVSIPENIVIDSLHIQTTPSMPIIDDTCPENVQFSTIPPANDGANEENFNDVPVSDMLIPKSQSVEVEDVSKQEEENLPEITDTISNEQIHRDNNNLTCDMSIVQDDINQEQTVTDNQQIVETMQIDCELNSEVDNSAEASTNPEEIPVSTESTSVNIQSEIFDDKLPIIQHEAEPVEAPAKIEIDNPEMQVENCTPLVTETNDDKETLQSQDEPMEIYSEEIEKAESSQTDTIVTDTEINSETTATTSTETTTKTSSSSATTPSPVETSQEYPSQSYEQFDTTEIPSQSATTKSENSREVTQSINYESMEIDESTSVTCDEPPTQSFEDIKPNKASQSYETSENTNAPTQSFNEVMSQCQDERLQSNGDEEIIDDTSSLTQSYDIGTIDTLSENLETDNELSQEGNIPSQSNDIANDDGSIGTSSGFSTNNTGLNEDETASSSYVPETPETQERDQDQESAISTSSYEIPMCEEINIASSSVIPDTSVEAEHTQSIHDNGVPEIPTSSYNLNPDSSSSTHHHVDAVPTSSYEDQIVVEQNVSTSYEVPISMPGLEGDSSQNFVSESTDHTNQPSSYYTQHPEDVTSEASQSYFVPEGPSPSYTSQNVSPSYYELSPTEHDAMMQCGSDVAPPNSANEDEDIVNATPPEQLFSPRQLLGTPGSHKRKNGDTDEPAARISRTEEDIIIPENPDESEEDEVLSGIINDDVRQEMQTENLKNQAKIALLGPIPDEGSTLFKGKNFLLTCASLDSLNRYKMKHKADSNSESGTDLEQEWNRIPFMRERLTAQITAGGGKVYEEFDDIPADEYGITKLITNFPNRTAKSLLCLSVGIPAWSHQWVIRSCLDNELVNPNQEKLPAGWSLNLNSYIEMSDRPSNKPFNYIIIAVPEITGHEEPMKLWTQIIENAGGTVRMIADPSDNFVEATAVVTNFGYPKWVVDRAENENIPLLSTEWIIRCLVEGALI